MPLDEVDLVLLHQVADALVELVGNSPGSTDDLVPVDADSFEVDSPLVAVVDGFRVELRIVQERLAGNAPPVQADASEPVSLDDGGFHAQLGGSNGSDIAAGAGTDDD